jgi:hypothetical protein
VILAGNCLDSNIFHVSVLNLENMILYKYYFFFFFLLFWFIGPEERLEDAKNIIGRVSVSFSDYYAFGYELSFGCFVSDFSSI